MKIAMEERRLLLAQRNLESIRLIAELLARAKALKQQQQAKERAEREEQERQEQSRQKEELARLQQLEACRRKQEEELRRVEVEKERCTGAPAPREGTKGEAALQPVEEGQQ
ncbi:A-kinase anchor protein 17A [Larimichthys crocea]|uniref:Uncharacterized protein n=1 Tax=Larimichthys crocea TaxID=215358 RepID=A0ACD3QIF0_LARCR|nr:A-kinase anchor protein 17A [Larimichthys crocea]